ncbi:MAG: SDR family NAD(P)-dependent oxidoreductase [Myxococcota bacterium]
MVDLSGRVVLITAGATGIGFGCAESVLAAGGRAMLCARREETLRAAVERLGEGAAWVRCDVTDEESVRAAVGATLERLGRLDGAVNCAGTGSVGALESVTLEEWNRVLATNLTGTFLCVREQVRAMAGRGGGSIVNISSIAGALTHPWMLAYCVSKAGLDMLSRCAADECGERGIRVNSVLPGVVHTPLAAVLAEQELSREEYLRLMPISRIGEPRDVGGLVAFLLSDAASWITGQCIPVDGGHTIRKGPDLRPMFRQLMGGR